MPLTDAAPLHPVAMVEADATFLPAEAEGETGFAVRRMYLGLAWQPRRWATVFGALNPVAGEHDPLVVDAYGRLTPNGPVDLTLGYTKTPPFTSAHDVGVETLPIPELSMSTKAFWPGRDTGADREETYGLRVGGGVHLEAAGDRAGLTGQTPLGFAFWDPPTVSGGASGEVAWMVTGQHRLLGSWPVTGQAVGIEVAGRGERVSLGAGASDVNAGGATGGAAAVRVWHPAGLCAGVTGGWFRYDTAPLEEPTVTTSWFVEARATARWL